MGEIFIDEGTAAEYVEKLTNITGTLDDILGVTPPNGTFMRVRNSERGNTPGVPLYIDLNDSNGNDLPSNTTVVFRLEVAGSDDELVVSRKLTNISKYNELALTEQRNTDNIDSTKVTLKQPDVQGGGAVPNIDFRDVDRFSIAIKSQAQIDWSNSSLYIDSSSVEGPFSKGA